MLNTAKRPIISPHASWFPARCAPLSSSSAAAIIRRYDALASLLPCDNPSTSHDGHAGEAWVNNAIQEATSSLRGMRFDDRVTATCAPTPRAPQIHIEIDRAEINKNVRLTPPRRRRSRVLERLMPTPSSDRSAWIRHVVN